MRWRWPLVAAALCCSCGERKCPVPNLDGAPLPMTAARAMELAPNIRTGLAVSVTERSGRCEMINTVDERGCDNSDCVDGRKRASVFVLGPNVSVPASADCGGEVAVADLRRLGAEEQITNDGGEVVVSAPPGLSLVWVSVNGLCGECPENEAGRGCRFDVTEGAIQARDLVLRRSF